jgi:hypothetical protein
MPRTIIDIPAAQLREVDRLCRQLAISRAEAVRRGLAALLHEHSDVAATGFGLWRDADMQRSKSHRAKTR